MEKEIEEEPGEEQDKLRLEKLKLELKELEESDDEEDEPPPKLALIQWAEQHRRVAAKTSASPDHWRTMVQPVKNWRERYVLTIDAGNAYGFDFFKARGKALKFSQIRPVGRDWEVVDDRNERIDWRRKEVISEEDYWKRR
jgi:hypothetical protein